MISHMPDIRAVIRRELDRRKWTPYRLAKELRGVVPQATIYQFLKGDHDINTTHAGKILDILEIHVVPAKK